MALAEILAILLPPLIEQVEALRKRGAAGELTTDQIRSRIERMRDAIAKAHQHDADIDHRIDGVR